MAVTTTQKSQAIIACVWLRTKVCHLWDDTRGCRLWFRRFGMYLRMVRGDTRRPSLSTSSLAIRSSPHDGFSEAM